jgi:hypothetical protein
LESIHAELSTPFLRHSNEVKRVGLGKWQNSQITNQGSLGHPQLLHNDPLWDFGLPELNGAFWATVLTLIGPGEVKVDLANFDLKLQENLLSTLYFFTYSCKNVFHIFLNFFFYMTSKNDFLTSILTYFRQKSGCGVLCCTPPFRPVLLDIQTTQVRQKSCWAVVRSTVLRQ